MSEYKQGTVSVTLGDDFALPKAAGHLSKTEAPSAEVPAN